MNRQLGFVFVAMLLTASFAPVAYAQSAKKPQTTGNKPAENVPQPKALAPLKANYEKTKAAFAKKPKDKKAREAFIKAATVYGHESMVSPDLPTSVKYRQALRLYREVLKLEPKHPVARPEHDLIVQIYKQMGRPVPK